MLKLKNSAMLVVAGLCGYVALMTPDWKSDLVAKTGLAYKNNYNYVADGANPMSDVLFVNTSTGGVQYWPGGVKASSVSGGNFDSTTYKYLASGDFGDGSTLNPADGNADLLLQNTATGMTVIWYSAQKVSPVPTYPGTATPGMAVAAVCDFDGDGKDDILWYNSTTGGTQMWHGAVKANISYPGTQSDLTQSVVGCGDFDGNGKEDILWRSVTNNTTTVWVDAVKTNKLYLTGNPVSTYSIVGVGDFDGDGGTRGNRSACITNDDLSTE